MDKFIEIAQTYGPLGLIILASFWYILYKDKQHREERKEFAEAFKQQHKEASEVTRNNTTVLTEIATLIRDRNRK